MYNLEKIKLQVEFLSASLMTWNLSVLQQNSSTEALAPNLNRQTFKYLNQISAEILHWPSRVVAPAGLRPVFLRPRCHPIVPAGPLPGMEDAQRVDCAIDSEGIEVNYSSRSTSFQSNRC
jgi:hypothetical protein